MTAIDTVSSLYRAFGESDMDTVGRLLADTHWNEAAGGPYGGVYRGFEEVAGNVFGRIAADVRDFSARPDELLAIGTDRVLALGTYRGETDAGPMAIRFGHLWTVAEGRISHFEQFTDTHHWRVATAS
ncbi:nuclear transport factor 2 family protein [Sphingomonas astaxanthinifaciens]|uniref:SnoaL-like domain-containing protein n=1 Tax=Sphingomonas astaxanthinifaciens DSM 22298 TaxID=1123267 RepID=A0ABQ5Z2Z9_9SPHN|nr:nuclear transport factor 2 family protein [Sphingomonas astaxanthinifaciens]GLR46339.1 hypothetical protein GCM10007925_00500 [Sphingomonas astaxanthinifaciens DSM 22298]